MAKSSTKKKKKLRRALDEETERAPSNKHKDVVASNDNVEEKKEEKERTIPTTTQQEKEPKQNKTTKEEEQESGKQESENPKQQEEQDNEDEQDMLTKTTFASLGLSEAVCEAASKVGWECATRIQSKVLPVALSGRDVIGLAETGSGKTGAFCLPVLDALLNNNGNNQNRRRGGRGVYAVMLAPTRELAFQIHEVVQALGGASCGLTSVCVVGGVDTTTQAIALARHPHVVVATPGRLVDHLTNTKGFHLRHVRFLIMDEADRMLSMDFEQELNQILHVLPDNSSDENQRQTMLFSATMTSKVEKLQRASLTNPVKIEVSTKFQTPSKLLQSYLFIPAKYKDCYLTYLINEFAGQTVLVFGATCANVQRLALMLRNLGFPAVCLHGQMSQPKRLGALHKFKSGSRDILVCTDVASRGLDIPSVDVVINFDLPGHGKDYIHRVGRTARAGRSGQAIAMVTQYDVEVYQRLEGLLGKKLPAYQLEEETVLVLLERVNEAQRLATRELKEQLQHKDNSKRRRKRGYDNENDENDGIQSMVEKELRKGYYAGGSGGRGGALPNQRGSKNKAKKHRRNR